MTPKAVLGSSVRFTTLSHILARRYRVVSRLNDDGKFQSETHLYKCYISFAKVEKNDFATLALRRETESSAPSWHRGLSHEALFRAYHYASRDWTRYIPNPSTPRYHSQSALLYHDSVSHRTGHSVYILYLAKVPLTAVRIAEQIHKSPQYSD